MKIGSLFSGIGGLELGLEQAGVGRVAWQVEKEPYCRAVLAKHWPDAVRYEDVREVGAHNLAPVDVICGGFPCQDISTAGRMAGILPGNRSGLWFEYARIIGELRPRFVVVENVSALLVRGLDVVLGSLAEIRYDAEWSSISACSVGAPHMRDRMFVVAYPSGIPKHNGIIRSTDVLCGGEGKVWGEFDSLLPRVADGASHRVDRLRALGNAVVPQVAAIVGQRLLEIDAELRGGLAA